MERSNELHVGRRLKSRCLEDIIWRAVLKLKRACRIVTEDWQSNPQKEQERKEVLQRYGNLFRPENLESLTRDAFLGFLNVKNNKHWSGIHRHGPDISESMERLKNALKILVDEERPIEERLETLRPKDGPPYIKYLGKAILTAILFVVYPDKYAVYNETTKGGLKALELLPDLSGKGFAEEYLEVNRIIEETADKCDMNLWQVDEVWWHAMNQSDEDMEDTLSLNKFGLEKHLEEFLVANWENTPLGETLDLYEDDGEVVGQQYNIQGVGKIDLLCTERKSGNLVVIELKKGRSSDAVVGQLLRYMGYIRCRMAKKGQNVRGIIILREPDEKMRYALSVVDDVEIFRYEVSFDLKPVDSIRYQ